MSRKETILEQSWPPTPDESPLFRAAQSSRYERRDDIQLQDAVKRTAELVPELIQLRQNPPSDQAIQETIKKLQDPASHSAAINYDRATTMGIPTEYIEPKSDEWDVLWRLHTKYVTKYGPSIGPNNIIEGHSVSYEVSPPGAL